MSAWLISRCKTTAPFLYIPPRRAAHSNKNRFSRTRQDQRQQALCHYQPEGGVCRDERQHLHRSEAWEDKSPACFDTVWAFHYLDDEDGAADQAEMDVIQANTASTSNDIIFHVYRNQSDIGSGTQEEDPAVHS